MREYPRIFYVSINYSLLDLRAHGTIGTNYVTSRPLVLPRALTLGQNDPKVTDTRYI
jgi:hypothetical protein